jgi:hypothetical protein
MVLAVLGAGALVTVLASLWRAVASDAYGVRPPPRSHHDVDDVDSWGLPTKFAGPR